MNLKALLINLINHIPYYNILKMLNFAIVCDDCMEICNVLAFCPCSDSKVILRNYYHLHRHEIC